MTNLETAATHLLEQVEQLLPAIIAGLFVILAGVIAAGLARALLRRIASRVEPQKHPLYHMASQAVGYLILSVGAVMGLGTMGVDVSALVASLGLTGFALGFALRDAVSNLLSGALIMLYRPFEYGDRISVTDVTGTIVDVNFRYTVLATGSDRIMVPNSTLFTNTVTVFGTERPGDHTIAVERNL
jgi:small conductance mechanosensitive channel